MDNLEKTMDGQDYAFQFVGWEADMAELLARKLNLSLQGLCELLLRPEACDASAQEPEEP